MKRGFFLLPLLLLTFAACDRFGAPTASPTPTHTATATVLPSRTLTPLPPPTLTDTPTQTRQPTKTATTTPTPTIVPTLTPTAYPSLPPGTPATGPEGYRLKVLTEGEMIALLDSDVSSEGDVHITLNKEFLTKFSNSPSRDMVEWQQATLYDLSARPGIFTRPSVAMLIENALNAGRVTPETLNQWLENYGFKVISVLPADNLLGDGQSGWAIHIEGIQRWEVAGFFALTGSPGQYRFQKVYGWEGLSHRDVGMEVADYNGNGLPEIVVNHHSWCGGYLPCEFFHLFLYEWQPTIREFVNLTWQVPSLYLDGLIRVNYKDTFPWQIDLSGEQGVPSIAAPISFMENCRPLDYQTIYTWDERQYRWSQEGYFSMNLSSSQECQLRAALMRGGREPDALLVLSNTLANWSTSFEESWGPAGKDYLRLQLGILQALNRQRSDAVQTLQTVRDQPENTQFQMSSQLAKTFLANYLNDEPLAACKGVVEHLNRALEAEIEFLEFSAYALDSAKTLWGFYDQRFYYDGDAACDLNSAFRLSLSIQQPQTPQELAAWLARIGIAHAPIQVADLSGDGTEDWLLIARFVDGRRWPIWAILRDNGGLIPIPIETFYTGKEGSISTNVRLQTLLPDPVFLPVAFLTQDDELLAFQLLPGSSYGVNILQREQWIDRVEVDPEQQTWSLFYPSSLSSFSNRTAEIIYRWEPYWQNYVVFETRLSTQGQTMTEIEQLLFDENQFSTAANALETLLAGEIIEASPEYPEIRPYLTYLLGLAYELQGDDANAVKAYWQLWHDFPDKPNSRPNPYTQLARAKLH